jgi:hypothetical protein
MYASIAEESKTTESTPFLPPPLPKEVLHRSSAVALQDSVQGLDGILRQRLQHDPIRALCDDIDELARSKADGVPDRLRNDDGSLA